MAAPDRQALVEYARRAASKNGINPDIFVAQIDQESGFDPTAHNPSGASGIAQLMPQYYPNVDTSDPYASLDAAAQTDAANLKRFGSVELMLAAYDAGPGAVERAGGVPDIAETQTYVRNILGSSGGRSGGLTHIMGSMQTGEQPPSATPTPAPGSRQAKIDAYVDDALSPGTSHSAIAMDADGNRVIINLDTGASIPVTGPGAKGVDPQNKPADLTQLHQEPDGSLYLINMVTGKTTPITGIRPLAPKGSGDFNTIYDPRTNQPIGLQNPTTGATITLPQGRDWGTDQLINNGTRGTFIIHKNPVQQPGRNGQDYTVETLIPPETQKPDTVTFPDGSLRSWNPATGQWDVLSGPDPDSQAARRLANAQAQRNLMPEQLRLLQDAESTMAEIHKQMAAGTVSGPEGTQLMGNIWKSVGAAMEGTTLFAKSTEAAREKEVQQGLGKELLNQRISSGSSMANSILQAAAGHVLMPKGQSTLGINPLAMASSAINTFGGGQDTGDFAKSLLMGSGIPSADGASSAMPPQGQNTAKFPTTREDVLKLYPELAQAGAQSAGQAA